MTLKQEIALIKQELAEVKKQLGKPVTKLLTSAEAADYCKMSPGVLRSLAKVGLIAHSQPGGAGGNLYFSPVDLDDYLQSRKKTSKRIKKAA